MSSSLGSRVRYRWSCRAREEFVEERESGGNLKTSCRLFGVVHCRCGHGDLNMVKILQSWQSTLDDLRLSPLTTKR